MQCRCRRKGWIGGGRVREPRAPRGPQQRRRLSRQAANSRAPEARASPLCQICQLHCRLPGALLANQLAWRVGTYLPCLGPLRSVVSPSRRLPLLPFPPRSTAGRAFGPTATMQPYVFGITRCVPFSVSANPPARGAAAAKRLFAGTSASMPCPPAVCGQQIQPRSPWAPHGGLAGS